MEKALADFDLIFESVKATSASELEADWTKVKGLEFRESLQSRDFLAAKLGFFTVTNDEDFVESVSLSDLLAKFNTDSCCRSTNSCTVNEYFKIKLLGE